MVMFHSKLLVYWMVIKLDQLLGTWFVGAGLGADPSFPHT